MKSMAHRSSAKRDALLRCDIRWATRMTNDPGGAGRQAGMEEREMKSSAMCRRGENRRKEMRRVGGLTLVKGRVREERVNEEMCGGGVRVIKDERKRRRPDDRKETWTEERPSDWTVYSRSWTSFLVPNQHCEDVRKTSNVQIRKKFRFCSSVLL